MEKKPDAKHPNPIQLPASGTPRAQVLETLRKHHDSDSNWQDGRTWSLVYHAGDEHTQFLKDAYSIYFHQNGLNPGAFPSLKKYESEVLSMAANLFHGGDTAAGTMTSGGTESIMMAIKTYRDFHFKTRGISQPEMIVPRTIHPAFDKAAQYFQVKILHAPVDADFRVDLGAVRKLITPNTILLVGSAPAYPQGVIDPIEDLAKLALEKGISMHVDACLGGFILPFLKKNGEKIPPFDFAVPGVTSISADLHKYGFTAKGASVILYKDKDLRRYQFFVTTEWPGGLFASPSMPGTRPGGSIAAAWATMQALGEEGYLRMHREIMETTRKLQRGVTELGCHVLGKPEASIFAFASDQVDLFAVADQMELRRWHIDRQHHPDCLHLMVTPAHAPAVGAFLKDLSECITYVKAHPELAGQGKAAMYGMVAKIPDPSMITGYLYQYMDDRYET